MPYYRAHGADTFSDAGRWDVIVIASDIEQAREIVNTHLTKLNQTGDYTLEQIEAVGPILFSSVEDGFDLRPDAYDYDRT